MAKTESKMVELGSISPGFTLPSPIDNKTYSYEDCRGDKATVVIFMCNHCPFVIHIAEGLSLFSKDWMAKGVNFIGINSNNVETHPDDSPEKMVETAKNWNLTFPYLFDESQEVAKSFGGACTPDFFVYGKDDKLIYRGQFDPSRPGNGVDVTGESLAQALDTYVKEGKILTDQKPSLGCNIKWK
ncbi:MAG: thioredoxin family protein [Leptospira sp.]|nr:thioredoxin family protein [Leptospira sp.]